MPEKHFLFNGLGYLQPMKAPDWPKKYPVGWGPCPARTPVWQKKKIWGMTVNALARFGFLQPVNTPDWKKK